jgi:tetratricopeptide (TPR) repeat protein
MARVYSIETLLRDGKFEESKDLAKAAVDEAQRHKLPFERATALGHYAECLGYLSAFDESEQFYREAIFIHETYKRMDLAQVWRVYMSRMLLDAGKIELAESELNSLLKYFTRKKDQNGIGATKLSLTSAAIKRKDFAKAELLALEALQVAEASLNPRVMMSVQLVLAEIAGKLGRIGDKIKYFDSFREQAKKSGMSEALINDGIEEIEEKIIEKR